MHKNVIASFLLLGSAFAADNALLRNGFSLRHERRELLPGGATTRLYMSTSKSDFVDVPTAEIAGFESAPLEIVSQSAIIAPTQTPPSIAEIVRQASDKTLIDEDLLNSVIQAESAANPQAVSRKGARGLMQLMPATARRLGVSEPFDPISNVDGGARYLHDLLVRFNFDLVKALAAYNAGPDAVTRYHGVPPYRETRAYVAHIIKDYNRKKLAQAGTQRSIKSVSASQTSRPVSPSKS